MSRFPLPARPVGPPDAKASDCRLSRAQPAPEPYSLGHDWAELESVVKAADLPRVLEGKERSDCRNVCLYPAAMLDSREFIGPAIRKSRMLGRPAGG